jgi:hypothetical protein
MKVNINSFDLCVLPFDLCVLPFWSVCTMILPILNMKVNINSFDPCILPFDLCDIDKSVSIVHMKLHVHPFDLCVLRFDLCVLGYWQVCTYCPHEVTCTSLWSLCITFWSLCTRILTSVHLLSTWSYTYIPLIFVFYPLVTVLYYSLWYIIETSYISKLYGITLRHHISVNCKYVHTMHHYLWLFIYIF